MWSVLVGFGIGLSLAAPPGPMNALIAREATRHGGLAGIRAGIIAPIVDVVLLVLVVLGLKNFNLDAYLPWAALAGAALMAYFALQTVRINPNPTGPVPKVGLPQVIFLGVTNPYAYAWWGTAGVALMADQGLGAMVGFVAGIFGWVFGFAYGMAHGANRWPWLVPTTTVLSANLLFVFAILLARMAALGF
jgi:threonine/homoserine/homoserine lactone efflux protein